MRKTLLTFVVFIAILFIQFSPAHGFDTSSLLLCSVINAAEYSLDEGCVEGTAYTFDIPQFIRINFQKQIVSEVGGTAGNRESEIRHLVESENQVIMQGVENNRSWSAIVDDRGNMTATISDRDFGVIIFGACLKQ